MELQIKNLVKNYKEKEVLRGAEYSFEEGKIYSILGRNGAGKTTLFNCLTKDVVYESGEMTLVENGIQRELAFDDIGLVSASPVLPEFLTGYEYVKFFMELNQTESVHTIDDYFRLVRIEESDRHRLIKEYSFGMKNKLQLLSCLMKNPKIILLDEPLSSFDIIVSHDIKELLLSMKDDHIILMSTHIMQLARDVSDEIVILKEGVLAKAEMQGESEAEFEKRVLELLQEEEAEETESNGDKTMSLSEFRKMKKEMRKGRKKKCS